MEDQFYAGVHSKQIEQDIHWALKPYQHLGRDQLLDLAQECRVRCWEARDRLRTRSGRQAAILNRRRDILRRWRQHEYVALDTERAVDFEREVDSQLLVEQFLGLLSPGDQAVLRALLAADGNKAQAAALLGWKSSRLRTYYMRAVWRWQVWWREFNE